MKLVRWVLGCIILFFNFVFTPRSKKRDPQEQTKLDQQTAQFKLYQFKACPFCVKVRWSMKRNNMKIKLCDAKRNEEIAYELENQGGKLKVPCLKITHLDGSSQWMYESKDIIAYLQNIADGDTRIQLEPSLAKAS